MSDTDEIGRPTKTGGTVKALKLEAEAQQVLDELLKEEKISFGLNVGKLTKASGEYIIHFHDSRIFTAHVPLTEGQSWAEMVRVAVLARVAKMSGPLKK
jgi:hypothetical protein